MTKKYLLLSDLIHDNCSCAINSYESLPTRNTPRNLITAYKDQKDKKYEINKEYPFQSLKNLHKHMEQK